LCNHGNEQREVGFQKRMFSSTEESYGINEMELLRYYLLVGLVTHKVVWEVLKRQQGRASTERRPSRSFRLTLVKAAKISVFLGIVAQTVVADVLPITQDSFTLRILGAAVYTVGLLVAILGRIHLDKNWTDIETPQVLSGQAVVSNGLYHYIRHPIYVGDLLLLLGLELSLNSWLVTAVGLMAPIVLWQAVREERMLVKNLPGYAEYCSTTRRFIPFVI